MKSGKAAAGAVLLFLLALAVRPEAARIGAQEGLALCAQVLIPALFPFSVGAGILIRMGAGSWAGHQLEPVMQRCFGLPGEAAVPLCVGFLGGYPLGAQALAEVYRSGRLSKTDAVRLSAFCVNAGPGFILGAVGLGVLRSPRLGAALLVIHVCSALLIGLLLGRGQGSLVRRSGSEPECLPFGEALLDALSASVSAMLRICGTVVLFSVLIRLLQTVPLLARLPDKVLAFFCGLLELSCGVLRLSSAGPAGAFVFSAALLGWGGLCVHLQTAQLLRAAGLPLRGYLSGKTVQALFSTALASGCVLVSSLLRNGETPVPALISGCAAGFLLVFIFFTFAEKPIGKIKNL